MIVKRLLKEAPWLSRDNNLFGTYYEKGLRFSLQSTEFNSLSECIMHYKALNISEPLNEFEFMTIGEAILIKNCYNGQFAWICEFTEMTEEEYNEEICEQG